MRKDASAVLKCIIAKDDNLIVTESEYEIVSHKPRKKENRNAVVCISLFVFYLLVSFCCLYYSAASAPSTTQNMLLYIVVLRGLIYSDSICFTAAGACPVDCVGIICFRGNYTGLVYSKVFYCSVAFNPAPTELFFLLSSEVSPPLLFFPSS